MRRIKSVSGTIFDTCNIIFLGLLGVIALFPYWNIIATSFVTSAEYYSRTFVLIPHKPDISAYLFIFSSDWIANGFKVSIIVTIWGTLYQMFLMASVAYGVTKKDLPGRKYILTYFIIVAYFGGGLIPFYLIVTKFLNLDNTLFALTMTQAVSVFSFIVLRTFFNEIPESLPESARIDGANEYVILFKIMLPLSLPALATLTLFSAVGFWNDWFGAMLFITDENKYPLQMILRRMILDVSNNAAQMEDMRKKYARLFGGEGSTIFDEAIKAATLTVTTIPIILVYPYLQKYFAKGVMIGSIKA